MIKYIFSKIFLFYRGIKEYMCIQLYTRKAKIQVKQYGEKLYVGGYSSFGGNVFLGNNCNFNGMRIIGKGEVHIGNNFHSGTECMIITSNHDYDNDNSIPYGINHIKKNIVIDDNVWLGNRVLITGNIRIGEGAIIAAGAVVVKDVEPYSIVGGNPAKFIKYRDINHYKLLKDKKCFH